MLYPKLMAELDKMEPTARAVCFNRLRLMALDNLSRHLREAQVPEPIDWETLPEEKSLITLRLPFEGILALADALSISLEPELKTQWFIPALKALADAYEGPDEADLHAALLKAADLLKDQG